jgi:hypothetical protein
MKLPEESIGEKLCDISVGSDYFEYHLKRTGKKPKTDTWDSIKLKKFCTVKKIINSVKRQSIEWEKRFANYPFNKGLIYKIYKGLNSIARKPIIQLKWSKNLNKHLSEKAEIWPTGIRCGPKNVYTCESM